MVSIRLLRFHTFLSIPFINLSLLCGHRYNRLLPVVSHNIPFFSQIRGIMQERISSDIPNFARQSLIPYTNIRSFSLFSKKNIETKKNLPVYKPKTDNQERYVKYLSDPTVKIILSVGSAGSGKTLFACIEAINSLIKGKIQKIILTRPVVCVEEDIGYLPGNLIDKMDPFTKPLFDILLEYFSQTEIDSMLQNGVLEISPLAFMRGRTFKNAFVIADEMQNSSPNQILMLTTRIGEGSKMVITGDLNQSDRGVDNGLSVFIRKLNYYDEYVRLYESYNSTYQYDGDKEIKLVSMSSVDIQRSSIVNKVLKLWDVPIEEKGQLLSLSETSNKNIVMTKNNEGNKTISSQKTTDFKPKITQFNEIFDIHTNNNNKNDDCALIPKIHNDISDKYRDTIPKLSQDKKSLDDNKTL